LCVKADLNKLVGKLHDELQQKKAIKVELQNCIQKLKVRFFRYVYIMLLYVNIYYVQKSA